MQQRLGHPGEWLERSMCEPQNAGDVGRDSLQRRQDFGGRQLTWAAPAWLSSFFILLLYRMRNGEEWGREGPEETLTFQLRPIIFSAGH